MQGGTFTITNPGGYGTFHGTPVISQPQAAILGTYAVVKRPWVIQDDLGEDVIAIRPIMNLTLTYDHRLVDGALAGRFLRDLREKLENWGRVEDQASPGRRRLAERATAWVDGHVERTGEVELVRTRPWAAIARVPTATGPSGSKTTRPATRSNRH